MDDCSTTKNAQDCNESGEKQNWNEITSSEFILKSLHSMNFLSPTPIQAAAIPQAIRYKKDVIGATETGSGKTLAFSIPILERWLSEQRQNLPAEEVNLFACVITPTRELAIQIRDVLKQLSAKTEPRTMNIVAIVGGMSEQKQHRLLKSRPDVVVATPGRLWALKQTGDEHLEDLSDLKILVVDEIDRMLEEGHFQELRYIVSDIHRYKKAQHIERDIEKQQTISEEKAVPDDGFPYLQTFIFSATLTFANQIPLKFCGKNGQTPTSLHLKQKIRRIVQSMSMRKGANKLAVIDLTPAQKTPKTLVECRMNCMDLLEKDTNLFYLLCRYGGRTLVFGNSISAIRRLQALLRKLFAGSKVILPRILHGRMREKKRLKSMEYFAASENSILLATDVAARGLDFQDVQNIIHYQAPKTTENYIHRSGRTARASKAGLSVIFVDPMDLYHYQKICRNMNKDEDLEVLAVDDNNLMENCRQLMQLATEAESLEHRLQKRRKRDEWFERVSKQADLQWDDEEERITRVDDKPEEEQKMFRRKKMVEKALNQMLKTALPMANDQHYQTNGRSGNGTGKKMVHADQHIGNGTEEIRKRLRLERGTKKWFKRARTMDATQ